MQPCKIALTAGLVIGLMFVSSAAMAQYNLTSLDTNQIGKATDIDPLIVNAWGIVHGPGTPWWVSDNNSGWSTLYDATGKPQPLRVLIGTAGHGPNSTKGLNGPGSPTGIVFNVGAINGANEFGVPSPALFLFATLDGTISAWTFKANRNEAVLAVDASSTGAVYTGLAITSRPSGNLLYAANVAKNRVDIFNNKFAYIGSFTDATLKGFSVFGIRDIDGFVYVTFAATSGGGGGFVEKFKEDGTPVTPGKQLISGAPLNQPWGIALAPSNFGPLSKTLLISNNTNAGTINGFDPSTGQFVGTLKENGSDIVIDQLWGIDFGDGTGQNGASNQLFFAAGPSDNLAGQFGSIVFK